MNWELITSPEFETAVEACGKTCVLPIGVVEKHGSHLPLGQDILYIHRIATLAAEKEPAMVFPMYYLGQILEAKHVPGTIALKPELLLPVLENMCDEIGRNGFDRIVIANGHGGNTEMLKWFLRTQLDTPKPYMLFVTTGFSHGPKEMREAKVDGHAGEGETCSMLHLRPELVKLDEYGDYGLPLKRLEAFDKAGLTTGIGWYSNFPGHFCGDRVTMNAEKGKAMVDAHVEHLAAQIRLVKEDDTPMALYREFHRRAVDPANRYP